MLIGQALPFTEVLDTAIMRRLALSDNTLNSFVCLEFLLLTLLVEKKLLSIFTAEIRIRKPLLIKLVSLDVVVDALQALIAFKEFVVLVCVV